MSREFLSWAVAAADVSAKATLLLFVAWVAVRLARRGPASARHMIWMVALGAVLLLPWLEAVAPRFTLVALPAPTRVTSDPAPVDASPQSSSDALLGAGVSLPIESGRVARSAPTSSVPVSLAAWVTVAWAAGCTAVFLSALVGWVALVRIKVRTLALPSNFGESVGGRRVRLRVSREGRPPTALTWGVLRPTILLPRSADEWPQERLDTVLLHELEHVRRGDAAMQFVSIAACALHWFNPAVWLAARAARTEAEAATDDAVLRRGVRPTDYANTLVEVAAEIGGRHHLALPTGVAFMKKSKIEARLRAILDGRARRGVTRTEKVAAVALAALFLLPLAFVRAAAIPPISALPDTSDPMVTIRVVRHQVVGKKLTKRQLAARELRRRHAPAVQAKAATELWVGGTASLESNAAKAEATPAQTDQAAKAGPMMGRGLIHASVAGGTSPSVTLERGNGDQRATIARSAVKSLRAFEVRGDDGSGLASDLGALRVSLDGAQSGALRVWLDGGQSASGDENSAKLEAVIKAHLNGLLQAGGDPQLARDQIRAALKMAAKAMQAQANAAQLEQAAKLQQLLKADKAALAAQGSGASSAAARQKLAAELAALAAANVSDGGQQDEARRKLKAELAAAEAQRAAMVAQESVMRRVMASTRAKLAAKAQEDARIRRADKLIKAKLLRGNPRASAKERRTMLVRERAALRAKLKAIEAELQKHGK
ncbi:MAG: M56 family metallopeptidase [Fimbriimonadaceae bacterium]